MNKSKRIFLENPYDIETFLDSLRIAEKRNKQYLFVDRFLAKLRLDPIQDIPNLCFEELDSLGLIEVKNKKWESHERK